MGLDALGWLRTEDYFLVLLKAEGVTDVTWKGSGFAAVFLGHVVSGVVVLGECQSRFVVAEGFGLSSSLAWKKTAFKIQWHFRAVPSALK